MIYSLLFRFNLFVWFSFGAKLKKVKKNYEVKSGYHLARDMVGKTSETSEAQSSCHSFPKSFWDSLWKLGTKNKFKCLFKKMCD